MTAPGEVYVRRLPELPGAPYRLGRHVRHDSRSRAYRVWLPAGTEIRDAEWTRRIGILNQGRIGSCTGNAGTGALGTDTAAEPGWAIVQGRPLDEAYAVQLYSDATAIDDAPGQYPPDDTGSDGLSIAKVLRARGVVSSYSHAFGLGDVLAGLQLGPVMLGTAWHEAMFTPDRNGEVHIGGQVAGGHEYVARILDTERRMVGCDNSWGASWGIAGSFWLSWDTLGELLADDGDATVLHPAAVTPPAPTPPLPDGCFRLDGDLLAPLHQATLKRWRHTGGPWTDEQEANLIVRAALHR